jgi:hypothetical protein
MNTVVNVNLWRFEVCLAQYFTGVRLWVQSPGPPLKRVVFVIWNNSMQRIFTCWLLKITPKLENI